MAEVNERAIEQASPPGQQSDNFDRSDLYSGVGDLGKSSIGPNGPQSGGFESSSVNPAGSGRLDFSKGSDIYGDQSGRASSSSNSGLDSAISASGPSTMPDGRSDVANSGTGAGNAKGFEAPASLSGNPNPSASGDSSGYANQGDVPASLSGNPNASASADSPGYANQADVPASLSGNPNPSASGDSSGYANQGDVPASLSGNPNPSASGDNPGYAKPAEASTNLSGSASAGASGDNPGYAKPAEASTNLSARGDSAATGDIAGHANAGDSGAFTRNDRASYGDGTKYDGSKFIELSDRDRETMPVSDINKVNQNNVQNLNSRAADLGDKMPDLALRAVGSEHSPNLEKIKAGQYPDIPEKRDFAVSQSKPDSPEGHIADLGAKMEKSRSYAELHGDNAKLYVFSHDKNLRGDFRQNGGPKSAEAPFPSTSNAGEAQIGLTPDFKHVTTLGANDLFAKQIPTNLPDYMQRVGALSAERTIGQVDKVMQAVEAPHQNQLQELRQQRQSQSESSLSGGQTGSDGFFRRIARKLTSW
ncbi:MAG: hypothetical protein IPO31_04235 [Candidatus Obscuribacter sp.]|nr:hypothetical protein [Candidatus Obscuribacter sp.]